MNEDNLDCKVLACFYRNNTCKVLVTLKQPKYKIVAAPTQHNTTSTSTVVGLTQMLAQLVVVVVVIVLAVFVLVKILIVHLLRPALGYCR